MRLASVEGSDGLRLHVKGARGYVDVAGATGEARYADLAAVLDDGERAFEAISRVADQPGRELAPAEFGPALPRPNRILCLGVNYLDHALEGGRPAPSWPECFVRGAPSVTGPFSDLVKPGLTDRFDFEGELGVVIGRRGRYVRAADAAGIIAGYVVLNDASAREWQRAATQWTPGKNFDGTMPVGPELVTCDEVDISDVELTTRVNGELMQQARTSQMIVSVAQAIEYFSSFTTLWPGDLIATGTPGGVGFARTPPVWLQPGDRVEVSVEGVGTISNPVTAEKEMPSEWPWHAPASDGRPRH